MSCPKLQIKKAKKLRDLLEKKIKIVYSGARKSIEKEC